MIGRIAMALLLVTGCGATASRGETGQDSRAVRGAEDPTVLDVERQIEAVIVQDSHETIRIENRKVLETVRHQFTLLDLSRSMNLRRRAIKVYGALQVSGRVDLDIEFEVYAGVKNGYLAFRVANVVFMSGELNRFPDLVVEGVVAHELSHDRRDYKRKLLIEMNDLDGELKQTLSARIESRADDRAVHLLADADRDPSAVTVFLKTLRRTGAVKEREAQARLAIAEAAERALPVR